MATINNERVHPFWERRDRDGFVDFAVANLKTARMEIPTRAVASRWYGVNVAIAETSGDHWIHREKDKLWWTISRPEPVEITLMPSFNPLRDGPSVFELHKQAHPWQDRDRKGRQLLWEALHPKARDFLFTEGTLQQLAPGNAEYALALINGDGLERWLGFSLQRFGSVRWTACRLIRTSCRCRGAAQGGRSPTGAAPRQRQFSHAATLCGRWSR